MITYSQLGNMGRLGNQIFQYSALYGIGFLRGFEIGVPDNPELELFKTFKISSANRIKESKAKRVYPEPGFAFNPNVWLVEDDTNLHGYFQSPFYWLNCAQNLLEELEFHDHIVKEGQQWLIDNGLDGKPLCSTHVRRGDYKNLPDYHTNLGMEYYNKAHQAINDNVEHELANLVFSDDPDWCEQNFPGFIIVRGNSPQVDLYLMSRCHVHIMANSSFSWWGAFLSLSQAVIAPKDWFGPEGPNKWDSIYMPHWNRL